MSGIIAQVGIVLFGMSAVWLANDHRAHIRRFGCVCGLLAQPFWVVTSYQHQQWGILAASVVYGYGWARGFYHQWMRHDLKP